MKGVLGLVVWAFPFFFCGGASARTVVEAMAPPFDEALRSYGFDGSVRIEVEVDRSGEVTQATVVDSFVPAVRKEFEGTLIACTKKWKIEPGPESSTESILFVFKFVFEHEVSEPGVMGVLFKSPSTMEVRAAWTDVVEFPDPIKRKK